MSEDELAKGQKWVEEALARLLGERGIKLGAPVKWALDFDHEVGLMEANMGGVTKLWKFSYEALEDCVGDRNVQRNIEKSLRMYFVPDGKSLDAQSLSSGTKPPKATASSEPPVRSTAKRWDVFISHASEDKEEIARPVAETLRKRGYSVWYDEYTLKLGDSLRESIDKGLAQSRYGVVVLSKHFFAKHWPTQELNGLAALEVNGEKVILPIWHGVTRADVVACSPILADRKAVSSQEGLDSVVAAIEAVVNPPMSEDIAELLRAAQDTLQEYQCSFCGAPLSQRGSVPLSERDEGMFEAFECGYSHIDGYMQSPCPSDPKFPQLADYDFAYKELTGDSIWKWQCFANGKTKKARMLSLMPGLGRTKEEARERVVKHYEEYAKPWKAR
jgi:hypothetical protein